METPCNFQCVFLDIEIPRKVSEGKIYKMFFDPTGRHLIITTETGDNYYLFEKWKKAKLLSKIKVNTLGNGKISRKDASVLICPCLFYPCST